jgi:hypothetical protein
MPDSDMCLGDECPTDKNKCLRYTAEPMKPYQRDVLPGIADGVCQEFLPIRQENP